MSEAVKTPSVATPNHPGEEISDVIADQPASTSVTATWNERVEASFLAALDCPPTERDAFLASVCAQDEDLQGRVRRLLTAYESGGNLLECTPEIEQKFALLRPENAGDHIGSYQLVRQIGEGGFGVIWMAEQKRPVKRQVALKIVKVGMDTREVVARFEQERQALAMMDHPHIARVLDGGMTPTGRPYFVMDLVDGVRITEFCDRERLSIDERLRILIGVCHAVQHAHQKGIIHRDLKPSNILVMRQDGVPIPKVIDFGVAKALQQKLTDHTFHTEADQIIGTPLYMSPEQADSTVLDVDTRSDVYSLGVLLYELLSGSTPFGTSDQKQKNMEAVRRFLCEQDPVRPAAAFHSLSPSRREKVAAQRCADPSRLTRKLSGDLGWITMKALEKDRDRRYESALALAADLERHLNHEAVLARPPSRTYRIRRFARRHKIGVLAGAAVALALIFGLAVSLTLLHRYQTTFARLRKTAPAFAVAAREHNRSGQLQEAIDKLNVAIELQGENSDFWLQRAALHRALQRLDAAIADYRKALELSPNDRRAAEGVSLCERLAALPRESDGSLSRECLLALFDAMKAEGRPAAELVPLAESLGRKKELALAIWVEHLQSLPNASNRPFAERLKFTDDGRLNLDLSETGVTDLSPLRAMPLAKLQLENCAELRSIEPLREMKLRELNLTKTAVTDLSALSEMQTLDTLFVDGSKVSDLTPLSGLLHLANLHANNCPINDLSALRTMQNLQFLDVCATGVTNFTPLAELPRLKQIWLHDLKEVDLEFTRNLPLKILSLIGVKKVKNLRTLASVNTLEVLTLPRSFLIGADPTEVRLVTDPARAAEFDAVNLLRGLPKLARLSCKQIGLRTSQIEDAESTSVFWPDWDKNVAIRRCCDALQAVGLNARIVRGSDGTWNFNLSRQKQITNLSIFAGPEFKGVAIGGLDFSHCSEIADLTPLRGLPLKELQLAHTRVADLSPLEQMTTLRELWIADTLVTDLRQIQRVPLTRIFMDKCNALKDVSPLKEIDTLEEIVLPEQVAPASIEALKALPKLRRISFTFNRDTRRAACEADAFWKWPFDLQWVRALRERLAIDPATPLDQIASQTADGTWKVKLNGSRITTLHDIKSAPISDLDLMGTAVTDLRELSGMPLRRLRLDGTPSGTDVAPLLECPTLEQFVLPPDARNIKGLRSPKMKALQRISFVAQESGAPDLSADQFWETNFEKEAR